MPVRNREKIRSKVHHRLNRDQGCKCWLPMAHQRRANNAITYEELEEWGERHRRQRERDFGKPSRLTAMKLLRLLRKWKKNPPPIYASTRLRLREDEVRVRDEAAEIALVIGVYSFLEGGAGKHRVTFTMLVDALARRFSDHYVQAHEVAPSLSSMRLETVRAVGRDLLLSGVSASRIWSTLIRFGRDPAFPLYKLSKVSTGDERAYYVTPRTSSSAYKTFMRWISEDTGFVTSAPRSHLLRIIPRTAHLASEVPPGNASQRAACDVCAEWKFNIVDLTERSEQLLRIQEAVCLVFDVNSFKEDFLKRRRKAAAVRRSIRRNYLIDPELPNAPRTHSFPGKRGRRRMRTTRSQREKEVFYRSMEMALQAPGSSSAGRPAVLRRDARAKRRVSFGKAAVKRFLAWMSHKDRPFGLNLLPTTQKEKLAAGRRAAAWREQIAARLNLYDKHDLFVKTFERIYKQVRMKKQRQLSVSRFGRMMNRRFKALDFWPTYVSSKGPSDESPEFDDAAGRGTLPEQNMEGYRVRWFKAFDPRSRKTIKLAGRDISSSQMQILALFAGDRKLEERTTDPSQSFKEWLAAKLWEWNNTSSKPLLRAMAGVASYRVDSETGKPDKRVEELVKELIMRVSYGSKAKTVEIDQGKDPGRFGPGWVEDGAQRFLDSVWAEYPIMREYLAVCERLATCVAKQRRYIGFTITDPSDGAAVCWNPIKMRKIKVKMDNGHAMIWTPAEESDAWGRYPVHEAALKKKIAPCLIQLLDAYYSALVMKKLEKLGIKTFVGIHDCWLVPQDKLDVLNVAMARASHGWYRGLGPIYKGLARYARHDRQIQDFVGRARCAWTRRIKSAELPRFRAKEVRA